jgi:hypothetical protein
VLPGGGLVQSDKRACGGARQGGNCPVAAEASRLCPQSSARAGSDHGNPLKQIELVAHRRAEPSLEEHFRRRKRAS